MSEKRGPGVALQIEAVSHAYGKAPVLSGVTLTCEPGQFVALVGPSGGGKTTLLNVVAGFVRPRQGRIWFDGKDVTGVAVHGRNLGVVFQSYALFPHMTALENVMFPLAARRVPRADSLRRAQAALEAVGLGDKAGSRPGALSGGQQQRVGLARAIVHRPGLLLMDEPMGALERSLRATLQEEIRRVHDEYGMTVLYVTHDPTEALLLADVIAVVRDGRLEQAGRPREVWDRPVNSFVARALGECNIITGMVKRPGSFVSTTGAGPFASSGGDGSAVQKQAVLLVRPESVRLNVDVAAEGLGPGWNTCVGSVERIDFAGNVRRVYTKVSGVGTVVSAELSCSSPELSVGDAVRVEWRVADCLVVNE